MALLDLFEGVVGSNTPPKFYTVTCVKNLKGFVTFEGIFAIAKLFCID